MCETSCIDEIDHKNAITHRWMKYDYFSEFLK